MGIGDMFSKVLKKEEENDGNPLTEIPQVKQSSSEMNESSGNEENTLPSADAVEESPQSEEIPSVSVELTNEKILDVLSDVYDPEIPIDIVNLGLIYGVDIEDGNVHVKMTMTAPGCPSSAEIAAESKLLIEELPDVKSANIEIVWDPPWDPSRMSEEARESMGF